MNEDTSKWRRGFGFVAAMLTALFISGALSGGVLLLILIYGIGDDFEGIASRQITLGIAVVSAIIAIPLAFLVFGRVAQYFDPEANDPLSDPVSCILAIVDPNDPDADSASLMAASEWLLLGPRRHFASWWPCWITEILEEGSGFDQGFQFETQQDLERLRGVAERLSQSRNWIWRRKAENELLRNQARQVCFAIERANETQQHLLLVYGTREDVHHFCPNAVPISDC